MPWKEATLLTLRKEFVHLADQPNANMSQLCRRFEISRKTGYKWLRRWRKEGTEGLMDRSRRPHHSPNQTSEEVEQQVLKAYKQYKEWGARKLRARMKRMIREGSLAMSLGQLPASSTILRILKRHDKWEPRDYGPGTDAATGRFERDRPNSLWQLDFKGEFPLEDGSLCYPLTLLDDYSRFNLGLRACPDMRRSTVKKQLTGIFTRYGLPEEILADNGAPWGSGLRTDDNRPYYTKLGVWLMRLGIRLIHSRPMHPQSHGKNERFNGTLKAELLYYEHFRELEHAQQRFNWWRDRYNLERPHQALDDQVPMDRYTSSQRSFPETLPPVEYAPTDELRKVDAGGAIYYQGGKYNVGKAFSGYQVAVRPQKDRGCPMVYFCNQSVRELPLD